jgi:hypothetical protein
MAAKKSGGLSWSWGTFGKLVLFTYIVLVLLTATKVLAEDLQAEPLGPDGFPADWWDGDTAPMGPVPPPLPAAVTATQPGPPTVPLATEVPPEMPAASRPKTFKIEELPRTTEAPSGTMPIALPAPAQPLSQTATVSPVSVSAGLEAAGALLPSNGGLAADVWQTAPRLEQVQRLRKVQPQTSPVLREAWRRLLLTQALAPSGTGGGHWLVVRAEALARLQLDEAAWSLWRQVDEANARQDEQLALGLVQAKMLAGQGAAGCELAREWAARTGRDSAWPVVVAVCALVAPADASPAAAALSLQLVKPILQSTNKPLLRVLEAVPNGVPPVLPGSGLARVGGPLGAVVLANYPALLTSDTIAVLPDMVLRRLQHTLPLPLALREEAALRLVAQTEWPTDAVDAWELLSMTLVREDWPAALQLEAAAQGKEVSPELIMTAAAWQNVPRVGDAAWGMWQASAGLTLPDLQARGQNQLRWAVWRKKAAENDWNMWLAAQDLENPQGAEDGQRLLLVAEALGMNVPASVWVQVRGRAAPIANAMDPVWQRVLQGVVSKQDVPGVLAVLGEGVAGRSLATVPPEMAAMVVRSLQEVGWPDLAVRAAAEALWPRKVLAEPASVPEPVEVRVTPTEVVSATEPVVPKPVVKKKKDLQPKMKVKQPARPKKPQAPVATKPHG